MSGSTPFVAPPCSLLAIVLPPHFSLTLSIFSPPPAPRVCSFHSPLLPSSIDGRHDFQKAGAFLLLLLPWIKFCCCAAHRSLRKAKSLRGSRRRALSFEGGSVDTAVGTEHEKERAKKKQLAKRKRYAKSYILTKTWSEMALDGREKKQMEKDQKVRRKISLKLHTKTKVEGSFSKEDLEDEGLSYTLGEEKEIDAYSKNHRIARQASTGEEHALSPFDLRELKRKGQLTERSPGGSNRSGNRRSVVNHIKDTLTVAKSTSRIQYQDKMARKLTLCGVNSDRLAL